MKNLLSIREREKTYRILIIFIVIISFGFSGFIYYQGINQAIENKKNIYVLVNDKALIRAKATDITNSRDVLTKGSIEHINKLIYEIVPDVAQINKQLKEAVVSSDSYTSNLIDALKQKNFYQIIISQNYYTILDTQSIEVDYSIIPSKFKYVGRLRIIRENNMSEREIITEGYIQDTGRSSISNERGFIIRKLTLIADKEIIKN